MPVQLSLFSALLFGATALAVLSAYIAAQQKVVPGARAFVVFMLLVGLWAGTYGIQLLYPTLPAQLFWDSVQYMGGLLTPIGFGVFVMYYVGRADRLTPARIAAVSVLPVVTAAVVWIPELQWLVRRDATLVRANGIAVADITYGPLFNLAVAYSYVAVVWGIGTLTLTTLRTRELYQKQTALVTLAAAVPFGGSVVTYVFDLTVIDYTPIGLAVVGVVFAVALTRYKLLDVYPIPRNEILTEIDTGVVVTDGQGRIVDVNPTAVEVLGVSELVGRRLGDLASPVAETMAEMDSETTNEVVVEGDRTRYFECVRSTLQSSGGFDDTSLYTLSEITERRRRQQALKAQNERLDRFAQVLTHDLRNPLSVADGAVELAEETPDSDHLDTVRDAHERMGEIIDDMLTLARSGQSVEQLDDVSVGAVAEEAWSLVETGRATLTIEGDATVRADRTRLKQLFENLFRNAVEHGGTDVTVRVGETDSGFFVADDGPGIPKADRGSVFDSGVSSRTDGAGIGLAIVRTIVKAHDWSIAVTDSDAGGARFEITV